MQRSDPHMQSWQSTSVVSWNVLRMVLLASQNSDRVLTIVYLPDYSTPWYITCIAASHLSSHCVSSSPVPHCALFVTAVTEAVPSY